MVCLHEEVCRFWISCIAEGWLASRYGAVCAVYIYWGGTLFPYLRHHLLVCLLFHFLIFGVFGLFI